MIDHHPSHGRYTLRLVTPNDRNFLLTLLRDSLSPYVVPIFGIWDPEISERSLDQANPADMCIVLVDGASAGYVRLSEENGWLYLAEIELLPDYRNQGLGTQIIADINAYADTNGLNVELQVLVNNPAQRLYERMGFKPTHIKMARQKERVKPSPA